MYFKRSVTYPYKIILIYFTNPKESMSWSWHINTVFEDDVFYRLETLDLLKVNLKAYNLHNGNM